MMDNNYHTPVLLSEVIEGLEIRSGKKYIDATLGGGGHTDGIIQNGGIVLGLDQDQDAIDYVEEKYRQLVQNKKLVLSKGNFVDIYHIASQQKFEPVNGILFDLGVSSRQFENAKRGFSFQRNGPLDMRMDSSLAVPARDLINALTIRELTELFITFGEEYKAKRIAEAIVRTRKEKSIDTTDELAEIITRVYGHTKNTIHPATKVFQALRIAVNDELHVLKDALPQALAVLAPGGRIVVITFHSLEDRIVKHAFLDFQKRELGMVVNKKPILPSEQEVKENRRSRSAKLRIFEKL